MKRWNPDIELHKENVKTVPIWIRMPNLELKYWGQGCLRKLGDIIGTTLKVDNVTLNKDRLAYARILVEVELDKEHPDYIRFQNEKGILIQQYIKYEWNLHSILSARNMDTHQTSVTSKPRSNGNQR
ncbi:2 3-bisphosphoglycerate-independent phosphoglycerate mutase [Bienertia sinuspersici]